MENQERTFHIEKKEAVQSNYRERLLKIVNDIEMHVRLIEPDKLMHNELHSDKYIDSTEESKEFEEVRKDVCESFGVPFDDEHIYIYDGKIGTQRSMRAFYVLIDVLKQASFYGEGRISHVILMNKLAERLSRVTGVPAKDITSDISNDIDNKYIMFKGFVSTDGFKEMSEGNRRVLETPIIDSNGERVETPENWFVTGHNMPPSTPQ